MWTWSLNWGEITSRIVVGACPLRPDDLKSIAERAGASALLSLQHDACHAYWRIDYQEMQRVGARLGLAMDRCPIRDFDIEDMRHQLPKAIAQLTPPSIVPNALTIMDWPQNPFRRKDAGLPVCRN